MERLSNRRFKVEWHKDLQGYFTEGGVVGEFIALWFEFRRWFLDNDWR